MNELAFWAICIVIAFASCDVIPAWKKVECLKTHSVEECKKI